MMIRRAIIARKMKFERVSKPSQLAKIFIGSGKIAMRMKAIGSNSQATELLIDMEFFLRLIIMITRKRRARILISICNLSIVFSFQ